MVTQPVITKMGGTMYLLHGELPDAAILPREADIRDELYCLSLHPHFTCALTSSVCLRGKEYPRRVAPSVRDMYLEGEE